MVATTLVTFLFSVPGAHSVEVIGSWDNFSQSYPLRKDVQKGHGHWSGCHSFQDIVCDGDPSEPVQMRNGGLKLGGTYWYFYKVNGMIEYHDPVHPSTASCPLLPGQTVNILHVPYFILPQASTDSLNELVKLNLTLNPEDRFACLKSHSTAKQATCELERPLPKAAVVEPVHKRHHFRLTTRPQTTGPRLMSPLYSLSNTTFLRTHVRGDQIRQKSKRPKSVPPIPSEFNDGKQRSASPSRLLCQQQKRQPTSQLSWWQSDSRTRHRGFTNPFKKFSRGTHDDDHIGSRSDDVDNNGNHLRERPQTSIQIQAMQCIHNVDRRSCRHRKCRRPLSAPSRLGPILSSQLFSKEDIPVSNTTPSWQDEDSGHMGFYQSWSHSKRASYTETSSGLSSLASSCFGPSTEDTDAEFLTPVQSLSPTASSRTSFEDENVFVAPSRTPSRQRSFRSALGRSLSLNLLNAGTQATKRGFSNEESVSPAKSASQHISRKTHSSAISQGPDLFRLHETLVEDLDILSSSPQLDLRFDSDSFGGRADLEPHKDPLFWQKLSSQETIKPAQPSAEHESLPFRRHSREDVTAIASINDRLLNIEASWQWAKASGDVEDGVGRHLGQPERPISSQEGQAVVRGPTAASGGDLVMELGYLGAMIA